MKKNIKAKKFKSFDDFDWKPGSYLIEKVNGKECVFCVLPCGDNFLNQDQKWGQQNIHDENKITLTPSIFCSPQKPCWHGFLRNGEFVEV